MFIGLIYSTLLAAWAVAAQDPPTGCYAVVNSLLSADSLLRADVFLEQVNTMLEGLGAGGLSQADLAEVCREPDPDTAEFCARYSNSAQYLANINSATGGVLRGLRDCLTVYTAGGPDYQIDYSGYYTASPVTPTDPSHPTPSQHRKRSAPQAAAAEKRWSIITERIRDGLTIEDTVLPTGKLKPFTNVTQLEARQQSTCSNTGNCFRTCPSCVLVEQLCGSLANFAIPKGCDLLGQYIGNAVGVLVRGLCTTASLECGPLFPICLFGCNRLATKVAAKLAARLCKVDYGLACARGRTNCNSCNAANNNVCGSGTSQCCVGETGTACGAGCCCCPVCFAPGGPNCDCLPAAC